MVQETKLSLLHRERARIARGLPAPRELHIQPTVPVHPGDQPRLGNEDGQWNAALHVDIDVPVIGDLPPSVQPSLITGHRERCNAQHVVPHLDVDRLGRVKGLSTNADDRGIKVEGERGGLAPAEMSKDVRRAGPGARRLLEEGKTGQHEERGELCLLHRELHVVRMG